MNKTIKDVAILANVSIATVSRVINDKGYISDKTRLKVTTAMNKLNYKPNTAARTLQGKSTSTIGVILPSLDNPLYSELFQDIVDKLDKLHYQTLLCTSNSHTEQEQQYFELLKANRVDGIITSSHSEIINIENMKDYPIVSFDRTISSEIPSVRSDNFEGGKQIAQIVLKEKKNNVLILSGSKEDFFQVSDRIKGMVDVFSKNEVLVDSASLDFESSLNLKKVLVRKLIENKTHDAICCTDDLTALTVLTVAKELNYSPLITGYDGSSFVRVFFPRIITVSQPIKDIADLMCDILIKKIHDPKLKFPHEYVLPIKIFS